MVDDHIEKILESLYNFMNCFFVAGKTAMKLFHRCLEI